MSIRELSRKHRRAELRNTSVETTHGVIPSKSPDAPFIYVTAIPNRAGHFPDEAMSMYAQEFPSSYNAGVAFKHVTPYFVAAVAA
jgi:hypothetical protein